MVFSSIIFLWVLLPCILLLYYVSPKPFKNGILTVFSLFFYAWGEPRYVVLMIFSVLLNYGFGRLVEKFGKKRWLLALCVTLNLLILGYFKYYNFLAEVLNPLLRGFDIALPAIQVTLPIGISFYTFQALSYVVDVYRGENQAQKNPLNMMLYISFFPQLIAGPIVKYHDIEEQIENRTVTLEGFSYGVKRFVFGLGKKVILANTFAEVVDAVYAYQAADVSQAMLWLTALLYMLQIYFDFSGYSDMAIGLGKMFGFTFIENFRLPYTATSIQDFWRKWHISFPSWFRRVRVYPAWRKPEGNRTDLHQPLDGLSSDRHLARGRLDLYFLGSLPWIFQCAGAYVLRKMAGEREIRPLAHVYAVFVVLIGWIFFRADTIGQAFYFIRYMFVPHSAVVLMERYMNRKLWMFLAAALLACGPVQWFWMKWKGRVLAQDGSVTVTSWIGYMAILWFSILLLVNNTYNPFIYFRF